MRGDAHVAGGILQVVVEFWQFTDIARGAQRGYRGQADIWTVIVQVVANRSRSAYAAHRLDRAAGNGRVLIVNKLR